ncbi:MAG: hypothetical protein Q4B13_04485 [Lautropia sp.]|nr:hypothetical protein [Lautropia sp.]
MLPWPLGSRQIGPLAEESFLDRARGGQPGGTRAPARQGRSGVAGGQQGRPAPRRRPGPAARG